MESLGHQLDLKLKQWKPKTSNEVKGLILEIMQRADEETLDISRSRKAEQEVLDAIESPRAR